MARNLKTSAIVLKMNPVGENHRGLTLLARDEGLLRPLAFGAQGAKSAFRGTAVPFHRGIAGLHYDGSKDHWRLTSFDLEDDYEGLRQDLDRFYAASAWAEVLLSSHGAGEDSAALFDLAAEALSLLAHSQARDITVLGVLFLWRFLGIDGVQPDLNRCGSCGRPLGEEGCSWDAQAQILCRRCQRPGGAELPRGARKWLEATAPRSMKDALSVGLATTAMAAAWSWLLLAAQVVLDRPLKAFRVFQ